MNNLAGSNSQMGALSIAKGYKRFGALSSSEDPNKLGDSVKGAIMASSIIIIWAAHSLFGINLGTAEITNFAIGAGSAVASLWTAYGLVKKGVITLSSLYYTWKASKLVPVMPESSPGGETNTAL